MAEFIDKEIKHVGIGEPISFKNKTESPFTVSAGLIFHKDGEYHVSVHDNQIIVLNEAPTIEAIPIDWINAKIERLKKYENNEFAVITANLFKSLLKDWKAEQEKQK